MNFLNLKAVLSLNGTGFALGLKRAESASKAFAKEIKGEFAKAFGTAALIAYTRHLTTLASKITDTSDQLGISTKALQEWSHAARQSGANLEHVTKYFEQLGLAREKALGGDAAAMSAFNRLGISGADLGTKSIEDLAEAIAETVRSGNVQELAASLRAIGGENASKLIPAMQNFNELAGQAKIVSDTHLETLRAMTDELGAMGDALGGTLLPYMAEFAKLAEGGVTVISTGLAMMGAAIKTLWNGGYGGSFKDTWAAMEKTFDDSITAWEQRRKAIEERAAARASRRSSSPILTANGPLHDVTPSKVKDAVERVAASNINRPGLTGWQGAGAAIRFAPNDSGREIARNTSQLIRKTEEVKVAILGKNEFVNLGAGFN